MKKLINIPDSIVEDLQLDTVKNKKGRKRFELSNRITEILVNHVTMLRSTDK
jgi:hypothetical protein